MSDLMEWTPDMIRTLATAMERRLGRPVVEVTPTTLRLVIKALRHFASQGFAHRWAGYTVEVTDHRLGTVGEEVGVVAHPAAAGLTSDLGHPSLRNCIAELGAAMRVIRGFGTLLALMPLVGSAGAQTACRLSTADCSVVAREIANEEIAKIVDQRTFAPVGMSPFERSQELIRRSTRRKIARIPYLPTRISNEEARIGLCNAIDNANAIDPGSHPVPKECR